MIANAVRWKKEDIYSWERQRQRMQLGERNKTFTAEKGNDSKCIQVEEKAVLTAEKGNDSECS